MELHSGCMVLPDGCESARHWAAATGCRRTFGIGVPVWSLRSASSCGMGDLRDLREFIDLLADCSVGLLQILPMNDAGLDGVPYSALSAFALDPAYVSLDDVATMLPDNAGWLAELDLARARFADAGRVDNVAVRSTRLGLLRRAFDLLDARGALGGLDEFQAENGWVQTYATFKVLRERAGYASWEGWNVPADSAVESLRGSPDFRFHIFCQWIMDRQMCSVHSHARARHVLLEGDIPILVARDSADVWSRPELFHMESAAGAPPDMYSEDGQTWGFPTYRWDVAAASGYDWWRSRLRHAARYYDLYRIDHVVGFFRIWTVDVNARNGREGWFDPSDESVWGDHGRTILRMMLDATDMLPLAEDLGTIPAICRSTLREMGICGMKVQRWEKNWNGDRRFIRLEDYDPLSVATLSTHDCEILADWWAAADETDRCEIWALMGRDGQPPARLDGDDGMELLAWFMRAGSAFVVLALQDVMHPVGLLPGTPAMHRINLPGLVGPQNWSWRCPVSTADLAENPAFTGLLRALAGALHA